MKNAQSRNTPYVAAVALSFVALGCEDGPTAPPGTPTPPLTKSVPTDGAGEVARSVWLTLSFSEAPDPASFATIGLDCGAGPHSIRMTLLEDARVIVNPAGELPPASHCALAWLGPDGEESIQFDVAAAGAPAPVAYDRDDASLIAPFPDDTLLVADPATKTGRSFAPPVLARPEDVQTLFAALVGATNGVDGFSPLAPFVVDLPAELDPTSLPADEVESLDPLASILLFDLTEGSRAREAFDLELKTGANNEGVMEHTLIVFPTRRLTPEHVYALVVTRRALVDATRPLEPSPFQVAALADEATRATDAQRSVGQIDDEVMDVLAESYPALERDDIALVLRASLRSMDHTADDLLAVRALLDELPPPSFTIEEVVALTNPNYPVAALITGTWQAPIFWGDDDFITRDGSGAPVQNGTEAVPFTLALPRAALSAAVPIVMYQHGNPGTAERDVPLFARDHLGSAGFAVVGFTDRPNRATMGSTDPGSDTTRRHVSILLSEHRFPDSIALIPNMEQLAFLRLIQALGTVDVLPVGAPDGSAELDPSSPLSYLGISNGSNHAAGMLAFAPEIRAAAMAVGGGRYFGAMIHQEDGRNDVYEFLTADFPDLRRSEFLAGSAIGQMGVDDKDWLNRAHLLYQDPLGLGSSKPSVLLTEGLGDSFVPIYSTRAAAAEMGLPHLAPVHAVVPFLEQVQGPLQGNIDATTTGAFYQYVASGIEGLEPSEGCEQQPEGHWCAHENPLARAQRIHFFVSALSGVPEIIDPVTE